MLPALQVRAEQDAYLAQLEAEGQLEGVYGKGVQVIQSEPGIAIKTKTADGAVRVYINVCTCCKVWGLLGVGSGVHRKRTADMQQMVPNPDAHTDSYTKSTQALSLAGMHKTTATV
jgi:hypothetical protein